MYKSRKCHECKKPCEGYYCKEHSYERRYGKQLTFEDVKYKQQKLKVEKI